jgi:hypothetical protein
VTLRTGDQYKCPVKLVAAVGCEKTKADGGCPYKRCDKVKTNHTKICVLDNKESPSCTEAKCQAHCVSSTKLDGTCTHWAYDVKVALTLFKLFCKPLVKNHLMMTANDSGTGQPTGHLYGGTGHLMNLTPGCDNPTSRRASATSLRGATTSASTRTTCSTP